MKYTAILILALTFCSCTTTKPPQEEPFTVDFNSPKIRAGEFEAQFDNLLSITGIRQIDVIVEYFPLEDAVCLQFRIDFMTYYQYWSREAREAYSIALERYKEDFAQRALGAKGSKKTRRQYGKTECYVMWQAFTYTVRARGSTTVDFGYDVKEVSNNRAPFFTLYQREVSYTEEMSQNERRTAPNMPIYLTRAKADELTAFFDQNFLDGLVPGRIKKNEPIVPDVY